MMTPFVKQVLSWLVPTHMLKLCCAKRPVVFRNEVKKPWLFYFWVPSGPANALILWLMLGNYFGLLGIMMIIVYPYSLLPGLRASNSPFKVDLKTESWLATVVITTYLLGSLMSAWLMEVFGRRMTHAFFILPSIMGWIIIYYSADITTLMIGRLLGGFIVGSVTVIGAAITGEYSSPAYRGFFSALRSVSICLGIVIMHLLTYCYNWRTIALFCIIPQAIAFCINLTWPESPSWLATKEKYQKSENIFFLLRGDDIRTHEEFEAMIKAQKKRLDDVPKTVLKEKVMLFLEKITRKSFGKPILIAGLTYVLAECTARNLFPAYAMDMIAGIDSDIRPNITIITLVIDVLTLLFSSFGCYLAKKLKMRSQLFASGVSSLVVLLFFCSYLFLESKGIILKRTPLIPVSLLIIYFCLSNLGIIPVYLNIYGEIFPLADKGTSIALSSITSCLSLMFWFKITPGLLVSIRVYGTFGVYGIIMALLLLILYLILPETKNRTLQEIEDYFVRGCFLDEDANKTTDKGEDLEMLSKQIN